MKALTAGDQPVQLPDRVQFESFVLLPRQLLHHGSPVKLGGRAYDLLQVLVELRSQVVSRQTLFDRVWPGRVVEDDNLKAQVMALRKALGPRAIATVPGRGYRFVASVVGDEAELLGEPVQPPPSPGCLRQAGSTLRIPSDPLIGRDRDLQRCLELVGLHGLVTICGPGGIGKTRLALACAGEVRAADPPDGAWFVELAALTQGEGVEQHLA